MMRSKSQPIDFRLGPTLCGGLTLRHYESFAQCESLEQYKNRISTQLPDYDKWGIHVMVSQNRENELIIGDSHEYGFSFDPFDKEDINQWILSYMRTFLNLDKLELKETWHGIYAKLPGSTEFVATPMSNVKIINGFGGAGMTFSFGYAMEEINGLLNC